MKVEAIVKFNDGIAFALNKKPVFKYYRQGDLIVGLDDTCTFIKSYYYEKPSFGFQAFGGREFDIELDTGEIIHCNGQWWDGGYSRAEVLLGEKLIDVTYNDIENLRSCYVYYGCYAVSDSLQQLHNKYTGQIHKYHDYEKMLKSLYPERRD